jgi:ubiquinone/menaquinone biosynthesis C-methylase UbiE
MAGWPWLLAAAGVILIAAAVYWLLVLTEGAYLGSGVVTALYDRVARRYDTIKQFDDEDEAYFLGRPVARFLANLPDTCEGPPWLLDVASGTGRLPLTVLRASKGGCRVVAMDRSSAMLAEARRKLDGQGWVDIVYLAHDAARLPFADGRFSVVSCLEALEFMPQPASVLAELLRVARSGGLVVLTNRIGREARLLPGRTFTRDALSAMLRSLGAAGVEIMPWQMDYDLVFAVKQGPATFDDASDWRAKVQCPRCGGQPVLPAGAESGTLACPAGDWRLILSDGLWRCDGNSRRNHLGR